VRTRIPTVSLDTVYRALRLLNDLGLVATLGPRQEAVRFDANLTHHHHFICVRCGLARDFESTALDNIPITDAAKQFGRVETTHVDIRGICKQCLETSR
jgi:Fur family peroxide stress response transcriptional regulator